MNCVGEITFLYQLVKGLAARSYGLNVARLAGVPQDILSVASVKSQDLETCVQQERYVALAFFFVVVCFF